MASPPKPTPTPTPTATPATPPAPATAPASGDPRVPQYEVAVNRIRETAKWLIAAFAAVGAALAASIPLSNFGDAQGSRLGWAIAGALIAFAGVAMAIFSVSRVLTPNALSLARMEKLVAPNVLADDTLLLATASTLPDLVTKFRGVQTATQDADLQYEEALRDTVDPDEPLSKAHLAALKRAKHFHSFHFDHINQPVRGLRGLAFFNEAMGRFTIARRLVALGAFLITAGMLMFSYGAAATPQPVSETRVWTRYIPAPPGPARPPRPRRPRRPPRALPYTG